MPKSSSPKTPTLAKLALEPDYEQWSLVNELHANFVQKSRQKACVNGVRQKRGK